jgi:hypothetical protein
MLYRKAVGSRVVRAARSLKLAFGRRCRALAAYQRVYRRLTHDVAMKNAYQTDSWRCRQEPVRPENPPTHYRELR